MKLRLFLFAAAIIVILAMLGGWVLRNELIQKLSGPTLQEYGLTITDVSLDVLATRDATIGFVEVVHESGTRIVIRDLTLPFLADQAGIRRYRAGRVTILTSTRDDDVPFETAEWLGRFLALPQLLAGNDIVIGRLEVQPFLPVSAIHWVLANDTQALSATADEIPLSVATAGSVAAGYELFMSTADATIGATVETTDNGYSIRAVQEVVLADWMPLAALAGLVPEKIRIGSGAADADLGFSIPFDTGVAPALNATIAPTSPWTVVYGDGSDDVTVQIGASGDVFSVRATFPEVSWSVSGNRAPLTVGAGDWRDIPVTLKSLSCESGIHCTMAATITMIDAGLPIGDVQAFEVEAALDIDVGEYETRVGFGPGARLLIRELASDAGTLHSLEAQAVSASTLAVKEDAWTLRADSVDGRVDRLSLADTASATAAVYLENVAVRGAADLIDMNSGVYVPSTKVAVSGTEVTAPGFRGTVSVAGSAVSASLETVGIDQNATIEARHDTSSGIGRMSLDEAGLSFGRRTLAQRVSPWPHPWNLSAGSMLLTLDADWRLRDDALSATSTVQFADLAGFHDDIAFTGLATTLHGVYTAATGFAIEPAELSLALVDVGLPVENISARYRFDAENQAVDVEYLRMEAFGGVIQADPFSYRTAAERNNLVLNAEGLDLVELLSMQDFEAISVAGRIDAVLPVAIVGNRIIVEDGTLTGVAPGGRIRYNPGPGYAPAPESGIALATRALSNFEFDALSSAVSFGESGDLKLQMKLTGRNPDLDSRRPVVLNLGVDTNIPQMLRSLQAARTVEDIIKKRAEQ